MSLASSLTGPLILIIISLIPGLRWRIPFVRSISFLKYQVHLHSRGNLTSTTPFPSRHVSIHRQHFTFIRSLIFLIWLTFLFFFQHDTFFEGTSRNTKILIFFALIILLISVFFFTCGDSKGYCLLLLHAVAMVMLPVLFIMAAVVAYIFVRLNNKQLLLDSD